jgi:thiosulfate/3-mercaptopyruvate sulfurtransferase
MQGTLQEWIDQGGKVDHEPVLPVRVDELDLKQPTQYQAVESTSMVNMEMVRSIVLGESEGIILDARSEGRFRGIAPEPRPGLRGGRMPNSFNVPATDLLDGSKYLTVEKLKAVFEKAGVSIGAKQKIICSCGSGVTACVIAAALQQCGRDPSDTFVFDGSWIEWASDLSNPVETSST